HNTRNNHNHQKPHVCQTRRSKVFVSKHNQSLQLSARDILDYCDAQGVETEGSRTTPSHVILRTCPFCDKPTHGKADNQHKCYLQIGGGAYFCHRCGNGGSWYDFKATLGGFHVTGAGVRHASVAQARTTEDRFRDFLETSTPVQRDVEPLPLPARKLQACYSTQLFDQGPNEVETYLRETRGLQKRTLRKYGVGRANYNFLDDANQWVKAECVSFPWIMKTKHQSFLTRRIKVRAVAKKSWQRLDPPGGGWGLFGFHTVPPEATEIILTEGEYDAMAVWQATGRPAVSLPNGCRSLPPEVLPLLENFAKIILWMDNDGPGQEGAEQFAKKIGLERTYIVKPGKQHVPEDAPLPKDANDALLQGLDLEAMVRDAQPVPHERILTFRDLRSSVLHEIIHPDKYVGVPMTSLPALTNIIKGFRRGEMTVLTGPTGSGKTTFLGQMSLDLAEQGINMLWGSFEIKNTRLIHKLMQQFSREPLPTGEQAVESKLEALADRFERLPFYFMKFHGGSDVDDVLDAMDYAVYVNDVEHIILDNMQFMISRNKNKTSTFDKFDVQDVAIEKFRKFATDKNVHVTLVVHPRKEQEDMKLSMASIYGSAKATQEADTVLILQTDGRRKYIEVKKNRFNGNLGHTPLHFDRLTGRYGE
ncbi:predicted protein, partial [Phaeodactylum tricornutum CCAP 1055/1]